MNPALIAFGFGIVVGVFGGLLFMGLFFMVKERGRAERITDVQTPLVAQEAEAGSLKAAYRKGYLQT